MAEIKIRISDDRIVEGLDKIIKEEGFSSRNQLINEILSQYVIMKDKLFLQNIPPVLKAICEENLSEQQQNNAFILQKNVEIMQKILMELSDLRAIFLSDLGKK